MGVWDTLKGVGRAAAGFNPLTQALVGGLSAAGDYLGDRRQGDQAERMNDRQLDLAEGRDARDAEIYREGAPLRGEAAAQILQRLRSGPAAMPDVSGFRDGANPFRGKFGAAPVPPPSGFQASASGAPIPPPTASSYLTSDPGRTHRETHGMGMTADRDASNRQMEGAHGTPVRYTTDGVPIYQTRR